jgi:type I restriction enzyme S subunit
MNKINNIMLLNVPPHWKIERLGQLFQERKEKVSDKDFPALSVTKNGIVMQMENVAKSDDGDNRKKVCKGDVVINSRSDRKGSSGISEYDGSVSLINIVLRPRHGHPKFLHYLIKSYSFQEEYYRFGHGIVADLWTTRFSEMKGIQVALPDIEEQVAIAEYLDAELSVIDSIIDNIGGRDCAVRAKAGTLLYTVLEKRAAIIDQAVRGQMDITQNRTISNKHTKKVVAS